MANDMVHLSLTYLNLGECEMQGVLNKVLKIFKVHIFLPELQVNSAEQLYNHKSSNAGLTLSK